MDADVQRIPVDALWRGWTNAEEDQRLTVIEARLVRNEATNQDLRAERRRIMNRAIRRKRRAEGLE